jgi:hypothetical protein
VEKLGADPPSLDRPVQLLGLRTIPAPPTGAGIARQPALELASACIWLRRLGRHGKQRLAQCSRPSPLAPAGAQTEASLESLRAILAE